MQFHLLNHGWMILDYKSNCSSTILFILFRNRRVQKNFRRTSTGFRCRITVIQHEIILAGGYKKPAGKRHCENRRDSTGLFLFSPVDGAEKQSGREWEVR
jgi:hypothetical protein